VEHALTMAQFTLAGGNIEDLLLQWSRECGPFYVFNIPANPPVLVVSDPDAVKEVCAAPLCLVVSMLVCLSEFPKGSLQLLQCSS
jgi:hypothetical protein